jgi:hypothetical protein
MGTLTTQTFEPVFTAEELGKQKKLHPATIRKIFIDEPGVIRLGSAGRRGRRQRYTLRIPESVVTRVFGRLTVGGGSSRSSGQ